MIRILIADDHELIRHGLRALFDRESDFEVVAEAADTAETLLQAQRHVLDVVVLDLNMPHCGEGEALPRLRRLRPELHILVLSVLPESAAALRCIKNGAAGFVCKESAAEDLVTAVRQVVAGGKYISPALAATLASRLATDSHATRHESLSKREFQVLQLIANGHSTRQIASALALSANTVATYRRRIFAKLELSSDVELTRYALQQHLLD